MKKSRKKYADSVNKYSKLKSIKQKSKSIKENDFVGDIYLNNFIEVSEPFILKKGLCIIDTGYKWLEFYDYNAKVRLSAVYNEKNEIVEWYFDIAKEIGKENNVPYEDDMYLDVVLTPSGEIILLDEDELQQALEQNEITMQEYDDAHKVAKELIKKINGKAKNVKEFTDKYLREIL